jgi:3-deoxy-D-manno-octulosonate cytidylyltransferase
VRLSILIPARYGAERLPGKPLRDLCGAPLIVRVCERAEAASGVDDLCVATDDERIASAVVAAGFRAVMTPRECRNGTERVSAASGIVRADAYVNVQGDEPLVDPGAITAVANLLRRGAEMATAARPLGAGEADDPSVVKVVLGEGGRALYFSRSLIPFPRNPGEVAPLAHLGIYGYSAAVLRKLAALPETPLERAEGLEQLRALHSGQRIDVVTGPWQSIAVDTPDDLERARAEFLREKRRTA